MAELAEIVTVGEAARIASVSAQTIRAWDHAGKLRAMQLTSAGWRLYRRADVERLVAARMRALELRRQVMEAKAS